MREKGGGDLSSQKVEASSVHKGIRADRQRVMICNPPRALPKSCFRSRFFMVAVIAIAAPCKSASASLCNSGSAPLRDVSDGIAASAATQSSITTSPGKGKDRSTPGIASSGVGCSHKPLDVATGLAATKVVG